MATAGVGIGPSIEEDGDFGEPASTLAAQSHCPVIVVRGADRPAVIAKARLLRARPPQKLAEPPRGHEVVARVDQDRVGGRGVLECDHVGGTGPYRVQQEPERGHDLRSRLGGIGEQEQLTHTAATSAPYRV